MPPNRLVMLVDESLSNIPRAMQSARVKLHSVNGDAPSRFPVPPA